MPGLCFPFFLSFSFSFLYFHGPVSNVAQAVSDTGPWTFTSSWLVEIKAFSEACMLGTWEGRKEGRAGFLACSCVRA
jgi:hypothetical protein